MAHLKERIVVKGRLGLSADFVHNLHCLDGEAARRCLTAEHDAVRAVQHCVGHVCSPPRGQTIPLAHRAQRKSPSASQASADECPLPGLDAIGHGGPALRTQLLYGMFRVFRKGESGAWRHARNHRADLRKVRTTAQPHMSAGLACMGSIYRVLERIFWHSSFCCTLCSLVDCRCWWVGDRAHPWPLRGWAAGS